MASTSASFVQKNFFNDRSMASTSASFVQKSFFKYDVFISFRGEDTRKTFVDHLYHALVSKGIITYKDDEKIEKGGRINDQLIKAIEESQFHIIVLSKNYASSSWCLDELVKIMECQKTAQQTAYPVFYDVEPTEVRKQSGAVGKAFAKHEKEEDASRWRDALKQAAGLAGWELKNTFDGHEAKFIEELIKEISPKLQFVSLNIDEKLVGMQIRVKNVVSSLEIGYDDVRMIGIKGIGGGGKTTLAKAVFNYISTSFEGKSFVENVREVSKGNPSGLKELQKKILSDVLNNHKFVEKNIQELEYVKKKVMRSLKVLLVLDDVDDIEQLEALAGELTWFKPGSRIIITTRDEQVLVAYRVSRDSIHDVNLLSNEEAIFLFCRYAFGGEIPNQVYQELSRKVVNYAAGLPLTIKVLGSHLCGRSEREWVDAVERLETVPLEKTLKRLELSYNGLENDQKDIFLDVVCILKGDMKDKAIRILESCGFKAEIGLRVLEQKSLITISDTEGLRFHDHIEEMGRDIVRRLYPDEPSCHSRLWIKEEIEDILINELGSKATRSIKLKNTDLHPPTIMKGLRNMRELRFLHVDNKYRKWEVDEVSQYLPEGLRSLYWYRYPFQSLPKTFRANNLVNLEMIGSNITELWEGGERKVLKKLRFLDLRFSMLRTFDLGMTPNIEILDLGKCSDFVIPADCPRLKSLNVSSSELSNINLTLTRNLETLKLKGCINLVDVNMTVELPNLKHLDLSDCKLSSLNLGLTPHLETLDLGGCKNFVELHIPIVCPKLRFLDLHGSRLSSLNLGLTPNLESLDLKECYEFAELHMPITCPKLKFLNLSYSKVSNLNLELTPSLEILYLERCNDFVELHMPSECSKLKSLNLRSCTMVRNLKNIGTLKHLKSLNLRSCWNLEQLPEDLGRLEALETLDLTYCYSLHDIPKSIGNMKCLKALEIHETYISRLPQGIYELKGLRITVRRQLEPYFYISDRHFSEYNVHMICRDGNYTRTRWVYPKPETFGTGMGSGKRVWGRVWDSFLFFSRVWVGYGIT